VISKRDAITIIFLGISLISAISLVHATINYVEFYRVIEKLDLKVVNVNTSVEQTKANISLSFKIINPTTYGDLKLQELSYILKYEVNDEPVDLHWDLTTYSEPIRIDSVSNITFQYAFDLNVGENVTQRFMHYYENHQGSVNWLLVCGALVDTFIGRMEIPLTATYKED
jgi:hypothetical protein